MEVQISVKLVSSFVDINRGVYIEDFTFFLPLGYEILMVFVFKIPFESKYHARTFISR